MRWSFLFAVFGLSVTSAASFAQRQPGDQRPSPTRSPSHDNGFFTSTGVVRFELVQGRLCLDEPRHRKGSQQRVDSEVFESITVSADRGIPSLHYVHKSPTHRLTLSVQQGRSLRLESLLVQPGERAELIQAPAESVRMTIHRGDLRDCIQGATLVHVRHACQPSFDRHFGDLIESLLRGQSLQTISDAAGAIALRDASATGPTLTQVSQLVEQLRSPQRAARVSSERQLLGWGAPVIPLLRSIPAGDLDVEQRARLDWIHCQLRPRVADTPASLAKLLATDRSYWQVRASQLHPDELMIANRQLRRLGVDPISIEAGPLERIAAAGE